MEINVDSLNGQMLEQGGQSSAGDVLLVITSGSSSANDLSGALAVARRKQLQVSVIAFGYSHPLGSLRLLQSLAEATGGLMTAIASKGVGTMSHISMLIQLGDALVPTLDHHQRTPAHNVPVLVSIAPIDTNVLHLLLI